jgi:hypothetical protein
MSTHRHALIAQQFVDARFSAEFHFRVQRHSSLFAALDRVS